MVHMLHTYIWRSESASASCGAGVERIVTSTSRGALDHDRVWQWQPLQRGLSTPIICASRSPR